jgi:hypothetical protein
VSEQLYMPLTWTRNDGGWWTGEGLLGAAPSLASPDAAKSREAREGGTE